MRIGHGYDVHSFGPGDFLVLGGVRIPYQQGLVAHSDGDVVIHALCDALLGAVALGDIGRHFPDTDQQFANIDSRLLLQDVIARVDDAGYRLGNADITIVAQAPKMSPHIELMVRNLAEVCETDISRVNVKATTTEKLGYIGRGEGIACHAVVLLDPK